MACLGRRLPFPVGFLLKLALAAVALELVNVAVNFPYATDALISKAERTRAAQEFYSQAYAAPAATTAEERQREERYVRIAEGAARAFEIDRKVTGFVQRYGLAGKRVLDVGAGRGYLQDVVENYVGLDISPTARRFFHKPFVLASATAMPFKDNEFDALWSVWTLEHIPQPEAALHEMRRVVKPGGRILLMPAWYCTRWAADGYEVRPYSDFGLGGKLIKASLPARRWLLYRLSYIIPIRALRSGAVKILGGPSAFHYTRLKPNYREYWTSDGDAVNSMDPYEARLWFESRGDRCENWPPGGLFQNEEILVFTVGPKD